MSILRVTYSKALKYFTILLSPLHSTQSLFLYTTLIIISCCPFCHLASCWNLLTDSVGGRSPSWKGFANLFPMVSQWPALIYPRFLPNTSVFHNPLVSLPFTSGIIDSLWIPPSFFSPFPPVKCSKLDYFSLSVHDFAALTERVFLMERIWFFGRSLLKY